MILSKIRLFESRKDYEGAYKLISNWIEKHPEQKNMLRVEYLKVLLKLDKKKKCLKNQNN